MLMVSVSQLEAKMTALSEEKTLQQKRNTELLEQYESILLDAQRDKSNQQYDLAKIKIEEVIEELLLN